MIGIAHLFFEYYGGILATSWQFQQLQYVRILLILYGLTFLLCSTWSTSITMKRCMTLAGALILGWLAAIFSLHPLLHGALLHGSLALVLLSYTVFPRLSVIAKMALFQIIYFTSSALMFFLLPSYYADSAPAVLSQYLPISITGWIVILLCIYVASAFAWKGKLLALVIISVLEGFVFLFLAMQLVPYAVWDRVMCYLMLGIFFVLFPLWRRFSVNWQGNKTNVVAEFIFLSTLILLSGIVLSLGNNIFREKYYNVDLAYDAKHLADETEAWILHSQRSLVVLSENPQTQAVIEKGNAELGTTLLRDFIRSSEDVVQVLIFNSNGDVIAYYPPTQPNLLNINFKFREYFQKAISGQPYIASRLIQASVQGEPWIIALSIPVRNENGEIIGVVAARPDLQALDTKLQEMKTEKSIEVSIIDDEGQMIATSKADQDFAIDENYRRNIVDRIWEHGVVSKLYISEKIRSGFRPSWLAFTPIPTVGWYVAIEQSSLGFTGFSEGFILLIMLMILLAGLFTIVAFRSKKGFAIFHFLRSKRGES